MAEVKKLIDINVDDSKFKRFLDLFKQYQDQLSKMPEEWKANAEAASEVTKEFGLMTAGLLAQTEIIHEQATAQKSADTAAIAAAKEKAKIEGDRQKAEQNHQKEVKQFWRDSATLTGNVARNALSITKNIAEFGIKGAALGLIGGGGLLFGLDVLAGRVSEQRKAAQGLGITTAENQAFGVNFGSRLVGSDFLAGVQGVKSDLNHYQFGQLGISEAEVQGSDSATLGIDVIRNAQRLWQQAGPGGRNQQWMQAHGLSAFMDFSTWQRIGQSSAGDIDSYAKQYQADRATMGASDSVQSDWQKFSIQMERAGDQIEAVFVKGLDPLIPGLTALSVDVEKALAGFLGNPHMKEWIQDVADGLQKAATYLGSDRFSADIHTVADDMVYAAQKLDDAMKFLGLIPSQAWGTGAADPTLPQVGNSADGGFWHHFFGPSWAHRLGVKGTYDFSEVAKKYGLPVSLFKAVAHYESNTQAHGPDSAAGAQGMMQQTPAYQKQYGVTDPYNVSQESNALGMGMSDYLKKYQGDLVKALAAYNEGPGNVDKQVAQYGSDWFSHAFDETKKIVPAELKDMNITVTVINQTGAQVGVIANGVRQ